MLAPMLLIIVGIFVTGIFMGLIQSFGYFKVVGLTDFTLKYYKEVLMDEDFIGAFQFSLYTSGVSSIIAVIFGVALAYTVLQLKSGRGVIASLFKLPIAVPHLVTTLFVYNLLSQSGILPRILNGAGLISNQSQFPSFLYESNGFGIILAYLWKEIPFVALTTFSILNRISHNYSDAAYNLGANKMQVFFYVQLPLILPSIFSSFIIIFAFSFGAYEIPFLLGPTQPKALSVLAYIEYSNPVLSNRPYAMAINMLITFTTIILTLLYFKIFEKVYKSSR